MATHSSIPAWEIPWTEARGGYSPWDCQELDMTEQLNTHTQTHTSILFQIPSPCKLLEC